MRLAMVYDYPFVRRGTRLYTHRSYGPFVDTFAPYFSGVRIYAPLAPADVTSLQYPLASANCCLRPLPFFDRWSRSLPAVVALARSLLRERDAWNVLYLRVPCPLALAAFPLARWLGRPIYLNIVGDLLEAMAEYHGLLRPLARTAGRAFDGYTKWMAQRALTITQGSVLADRYRGPRVVSVINSTVSETQLVQRPAIRHVAPVRLLFVGALLEKKGVQVLLDAVARLQPVLDLRLTVVGAGPAEVCLRNRARTLGCADRVDFAGEVTIEEELTRYYLDADIFVLPSLAEGVPRVVIEAMAHGVPVVTSNVGGVPDLVRSEVNGLLVAPGSQEELATAIERLASNPRLRADLAENGLRTARQYTREAYAQAAVALLQGYVTESFPQQLAEWPDHPAPPPGSPER